MFVSLRGGGGVRFVGVQPLGVGFMSKSLVLAVANKPAYTMMVS